MTDMPVALPSQLKCFTRPFAALLLAVAAASPVRADVTDAMREVERRGVARVILRMNTDNARANWLPQDTAAQQGVAVAAARARMEPHLRRAGIAGARSFRTLPFVAATVSREQLLSLAESSSVQGVYLVQTERKLEVMGERPQLATSIPSIGVAEAWAAGFDGTGYAVAVIDGGFNVNHPMLAGKNIGDACFGHTFGTTQTAQCPSGATPEISIGAASNCPAGSTRCDHGTHVASIAVGNDGTRFGVARGARFVPIDVFSRVTDPAGCSPDPAPCELTDSLAVLDGLDYINQNVDALKIAAVNISVGGSLRDGYCDDDVRKPVIDMLRAKGVAVAISAGNEAATGRVVAPACISSAIGVGATDDGVNVASFSNYAGILDLMAPGVNVTAAAGSGTSTATRSGTSMAAPHMAGAWAVMRQALPNQQFDVMETAFKQTGLETMRAGANVTVPKIQVARAIIRAKGGDRRFFNNVVTSSFNAVGASFVRLANNSDAPGNVTVSLRDTSTGQIVATWKSPNIPGRASRQFAVDTMEREAVPTGLSPAATNARTYLNLEMSSTFTGYVQHVIWARAAGIFSNLTSCAAGFSADTTWATNVHSSAITDYVSRLWIVNTGTTSQRAALGFVSQATGAGIVKFQTPPIAPGATLEVTIPQLEALLPALANATAAGVSQYNVLLFEFDGYLQHVIENRIVGALVDMSPKCDLPAASNTTATAAQAK